MRHRLLVVLLALGTVAGYGSGFASLSCRAHARRAAFERHVAHVCAEAAKNPASAPATDPYDRW